MKTPEKLMLTPMHCIQITEKIISVSDINYQAPSLSSESVILSQSAIRLPITPITYTNTDNELIVANIAVLKASLSHLTLHPNQDIISYYCDQGDFNPLVTAYFGPFQSAQLLNEMEDFSRLFHEKSAAYQHLSSSLQPGHDISISAWERLLGAQNLKYTLYEKYPNEGKSTQDLQNSIPPKIAQQAAQQPAVAKTHKPLINSAGHLPDSNHNSLTFEKANSSALENNLEQRDTLQPISTELTIEWLWQEIKGKEYFGLSAQDFFSLLSETYSQELSERVNAKCLLTYKKLGASDDFCNRFEKFMRSLKIDTTAMRESGHGK